MDTRSDAKTERPADTREALITAASLVFAQKGYDGATVKELAEAAGVNVSLVSYYFKGKEGLYRACLERFGKERLAAAERMLQEPQSVEEFRVRLKMFVEEFVRCHLESPNQACIIHREMGTSMEVTRDIFVGTFVKIFERLKLFLEAAQRTGIVRADLDTHISATLFMGGVVHASRVDGIQKEVFGKSLSDPAYRESFIDTALRNFMSGVLKG
jgi:AcrR family transcriptional regulator